MTRKPTPFIDLLLGVVLPSIILMKFSDSDALGIKGALILALAFPVILGLYELIRYRSRNYIALLGVVSVLLTGGIGLLELDPKWLAVKEAAIPALIGMTIIGAAMLGYPLVKNLLYSPKLFDTDKINRILDQNGQQDVFNARLTMATYMIGVTFFFSAAMNYILTVWIVTSPAGSEAFNEELGQLTLVSYPVIALPSMAMMLGILYFLWRTIRAYTGLTMEEVLSPSLAQDKASG